MPIFGLGLHVLVAIFFAVHAVRSGRELYWIAILFMFPVVGSIVYFFAVFLPHSRLERGARKAGVVIQKRLDPGRELREARAAFDLTPTAHNQMRLAAALFDAGEVAASVREFDACLAGPFAKDAEIGVGAARACLANGEPLRAVGMLQSVIANHPGFQAEQVGLLLAKAQAAAGRQQDAHVQFVALLQRFASIEVYGEYGLWAQAQGNQALAEQQFAEVAQLRKHMSRYTLGLHSDLLRRVDSAIAGGGRVITLS
jgi:hypothetical protein